MELYKPFKSKAKNKKYSVYVKGGKLIHFGDKRYGQYKNKIGAIPPNSARRASGAAVGAHGAGRAAAGLRRCRLVCSWLCSSRATCLSRLQLPRNSA